MKYNAPYGSTDPDRGYADRGSPGAVRGSVPPGAAIEQPQREIVNLIGKSGFTPSDADLMQMTRAVRSQRLNFAAAGGTANALTVTLDPAPASLAEIDGLMLRLRLGFNNTGAATLKVNDLDAKPIVAPNGAAIREGDLVATALVTVVYSVAAGAWCLLTSARAASQAVGFAANTYAGGALPSSVSTNVRFSNVVYDSSSAYSPSTGIFAAPEAGAYIVTANFWFQDISEATQVFIVQNGVSRAEAAAWTRGRVLAVSALLRCAKNDQIRVAAVQNNASPMTVPAGTFQHAFGASLIGSI